METEKAYREDTEHCYVPGRNRENDKEMGGGRMATMLFFFFLREAARSSSLGERGERFLLFTQLESISFTMYHDHKPHLYHHYKKIDH
jgi:hypothetical protein